MWLETQRRRQVEVYYLFYYRKSNKRLTWFWTDCTETTAFRDYENFVTVFISFLSLMPNLISSHRSWLLVPRRRLCVLRMIELMFVKLSAMSWALLFPHFVCSFTSDNRTHQEMEVHHNLGIVLLSGWLRSKFVLAGKYYFQKVEATMCELFLGTFAP